MNTDRPKVIVILGMHRSGTSALSRVLNILGVDLGSDLVAAKSDNPKGFWEHREIRDLDIKLLEDIGSFWHDVRPMPDNWWETDIARAYRLRFLEVVKRNFSGTALWGIKDPQMCKVLRVWLEVFSEFAVDPHFVIVFRNPLEVAASLEARGIPLMSLDQSLMLWLQHVLESESNTRTYPRTFVSFADFMSDWRGTASHVAELLKIQWPRSYEEAAEDASEFLEAGLKHHNIRDDALSEDPSIPEHVSQVYNALLESGIDPYGQIVEVCQSVKRKLDEESLTLTARSLSCELRTMLEHPQFMAFRDAGIAERNLQIEGLEAELAWMKNSNSWKITRPLRHVFKRLFK